MKSFAKGLLVASLINAILVICPGILHAQQYLYTNDNTFYGNNTTTAVKVSKTGAVKVIRSYSTGGPGAGSAAYYAVVGAAVAKTSAAQCLFVSNGGNSTIAAFTVALSTGKLKKVDGSPFSYGVGSSQPLGVGLAVGGNQLLFAGNSGVDSISVLKISSECSLTAGKTYSVPGSPDGMQVTPNGKYLIAAYVGPVDSFQIDYSTGELTELGPFKPQSYPAGVEISCDSSTVYFGDAATYTEQVEVFSIGTSGELTELNNYSDNHGQNSNNVLLGRDGKHLYVSNNHSNQVTTLSVGSRGRLTYDSTINVAKPGVNTLGLAIGKTGPDIFLEEVNNPEAIGVFATRENTLKEIPGSPFGVVENEGDAASFIAVPPKACKQ
jgi:6-phosphogluconolactonase (cycloisomerase 2 family)